MLRVTTSLEGREEKKERGYSPHEEKDSNINQSYPLASESYRVIYNWVGQLYITGSEKGEED